MEMSKVELQETYKFQLMRRRLRKEINYGIEPLKKVILNDRAFFNLVCHFKKRRNKQVKANFDIKRMEWLYETKYQMEIRDKILYHLVQKNYWIWNDLYCTTPIYPFSKYQLILLKQNYFHWFFNLQISPYLSSNVCQDVCQIIFMYANSFYEDVENKLNFNQQTVKKKSAIPWSRPESMTYVFD